MLTVLENLKETMKLNGTPDRFVNSWEFVNVVFATNYYMGDYPLEPGKEGYDQYGVLWRFPEGQMGAFPVHDAEHKLMDDVTEWKNIITHKPFIPDDPGYWGMLNGWAGNTDFENQYACALAPQGIFERLHAMMGMEDTMIGMYEEPEAMHELIEFITEVELEYAETIMTRVPAIKALLHHDDWGSAKNSFLSPEMHAEFLTPYYKRIYSRWRELGCELIIHHSDSWSRNLVPQMIEMGIDIWQGVFPDNNIPEMVEEFGDKITFMGEIESRRIDIPESTPEMVREEVERACRKCKGHNFIPSLTAGTPGSSFPGIEQQVKDEIDRMSKELF
ncbi:MAG: uroporphyrinogen decarboxylase family protein [Lachnospiraceae bacterium]|nr:uroporphyrinogen decarboxylase family protein [Lachnospiraceae bacterium]